MFIDLFSVHVHGGSHVSLNYMDVGKRYESHFKCVLYLVSLSWAQNGPPAVLLEGTVTFSVPAFITLLNTIRQPLAELPRANVQFSIASVL